MAVATQEVAGLRQMDTEFDQLSVDGQQVIEASEADSHKYAYWRRADGWITTFPNWPNEAVKKFKQGWTALLHYGEFLKESPDEGWSIRQNKYYRILAMGGAHEFPVEQILELGWAEHPPVVVVNGRRNMAVFHQLAEARAAGKVFKDECPVCKRVFESTDPEQPYRVRVKHEQIAHRATFEQQRYGETIGRALEKAAAQKADDPMVRLMEMVVQQSVALSEQVKQQGDALQVLLAERQGKKAV